MSEFNVKIKTLLLVCTTEAEREVLKDLKQTHQNELNEQEATFNKYWHKLLDKNSPKYISTNDGLDYIKITGEIINNLPEDAVPTFVTKAHPEL